MAKRTSKAAAAPAAAASHFTDRGRGTVTDTRTGLTWSKETLAAGHIHADAVKACKALRLAGFSDWRLPTRAELLTLVDDTRHEPAIDVAAFPDTKSDWYWTSTLTAWDPSCAWVVSFFLGSADYLHRDDLAFVRAVRSARASQ